MSEVCKFVQQVQRVHTVGSLSPSQTGFCSARFLVLFFSVPLVSAQRTGGVVVMKTFLLLLLLLEKNKNGGSKGDGRIRWK